MDEETAAEMQALCENEPDLVEELILKRKWRNT